MAVSLGCTLLIELVLAYFLGVRVRKDLVNVFLVNVLTNPLVVSLMLFVNIRYGAHIKAIVTIFLEILVFFSEGLIYNKVLEYKKLKGLTLSLILNIASYGIGLIINELVW